MLDFPGNIRITEMTEDCLDDIVQLERECFSSPWNRAMLEPELSNPVARFFAAYADGQLAGYAGMYDVSGECSLANIAVSRQFRRRGIGEALLDRLISAAEKDDAEFITLEVRRSNTPAVSLYEKKGFSCVGVRKNYYSAPCEDALLMTKFFKKGTDN